MYSNAIISKAAVLALIAGAAIAAPVPPQFPGVAFHGAPQAKPSPVDYQITNGNGTVFTPESTNAPTQGGLDNNSNRAQQDSIDFGNLNTTQLEQLQDALLGNYTLPLLNLTEKVLFEDGPRLLATLEAQLDDLGQSANAGVQQSQTAAAKPTPTVGVATSKQLSEIDKLIKSIQGALPKGNAGLIRREEKVMIAGKPVSFPLDPSQY